MHQNTTPILHAESLTQNVCYVHHAPFSASPQSVNDQKANVQLHDPDQDPSHDTRSLFSSPSLPVLPLCFCHAVNRMGGRQRNSTTASSRNFNYEGVRQREKDVVIREARSRKGEGPVPPKPDNETSYVGYFPSKVGFFAFWWCLNIVDWLRRGSSHPGLTAHHLYTAPSYKLIHGNSYY